MGTLDSWKVSSLELMILVRYQAGCQKFGPRPGALQHFINNLNEKVAEICIKFAGATKLSVLVV